MKFKGMIFSSAAALLVAATSVNAESQGDTMKAAGHTQHSDPVSGSQGKGGFTLTGYVDALAAYSTASENFRGSTQALSNQFFAGASTGVNLSDSGTRLGCGGSATCRDNDLTFAAGEVLISLKKDFGGKGIAAATLSFAEAGAGDETNSTGFALTVEEAYAGINLADNVNLYLGRYIAPIGIESVWSNARKNVTMSNLFAGGLPFYYTGLMLAYEPTEGPFAKAMIFNDAGGANIDGNVSKGYSLLVGYTGGGAYVGLTWVGNTAAQAAAVPLTPGPRREDWTNLFNLDVTYTMDKAYVGFEALYVRTNLGAGVSAAQWMGAMLIASYKATDAVEAGLRLEYNYYDPEQAILLGVDPATFGGAPLGSVKGASIAPFAIYTVTDGLFVRGEYRLDMEQPFNGEKLGANYGYSHLLALNVNATF